MHFSARAALLASCLAISVHALPVTYSVVDVDGGSAANGATGSSLDQPATIYQTVTKSQDVEEPEPTTVSVSVTIVETQHASATSTSASSSSSLSSSVSSSTASAQASSSASSPVATATSTLDALSGLESASSTFLTRHTSIVPTSSAKPTITQAPAVSASQAPPSSTSECEASSITVTDEVTDAAETVTATQVTSERSTVVLLSTTTITPSAAPTSYYDDGMWHTRYAIKPAASPSPEPVVPATKDDEAAPEVNKPSKPVDDKPAHVHPNAAANATSQAGDATHHARRELEPVAPTPTVPAVAADSVPEVSGTPLMLVQPLRQDVPGAAAPSDASTADAVVSPDVLLANDVKAIKREATYNVVSWNETTEG